LLDLIVWFNIPRLGHNSFRRGKIMADDAWFYAKGEQQIGPVPLQRLRELADTGELRREDLVWTEGRTQWIPASTIPAIFEMRVTQPAPIAPMPPGMPIGYFSQTREVHYAGFWLRFAAAFIDGLITGTGTFFVAFIIGLMVGVIFTVGGTPRPEIDAIGRFLGQLVGLVIGWLYEALMESSSKQATLGKMALGIIVTDDFGNRISFARASGRYFGKWLSAFILLIGYMMAGWTEKKQALHDMIAGTLVVRKAA
jgi:uncharacterized RDD family membrane protein YckC